MDDVPSRLPSPLSTMDTQQLATQSEHPKTIFSLPGGLSLPHIAPHDNNHIDKIKKIAGPKQQSVPDFPGQSSPSLEISTWQNSQSKKQIIDVEREAITRTAVS